MPFRWDFDPVITNLWGIELRWYGVCFAIGILLAAVQLPKSYYRRGFDERDVDTMSLWLPVFMIVGAHLVHMVFYDTHVFRALANDPFSWDSWKPIVDLRSGLASHGGGLGCILAVLLYARRRGHNVFELLDATMVGAVWVFPWVRIGNFMNSEIFGRPTDVPWAVVFSRVSSEPRHPTQLYEAALGFLLIGVAVVIDRRYARRLRPGATFFLLLGLYFLWRFLVEYFKAYQTLAQDASALTMGQWLSLPIFTVCFSVLLFSKRHGILTPPDEDQRWWERMEASDDAAEASGEVDADTNADAAEAG